MEAEEHFSDHHHTGILPAVHPLFVSVLMLCSRLAFILALGLAFHEDLRLLFYAGVSPTYTFWSSVMFYIIAKVVVMNS